MSNKYMFEAVATLVGTIIGAGVLGIPYVVAKAGLITGIINIVVLGLLLLFLNLYVGEITLRTNGVHQLTGLAEKYLGKKGKLLMMLSMLIGIYGALLAYFIGVGESLYALLNILNPFILGVIFLIIVSLLIYFGLKAIERSELFVGALMLVVILLIGFISIFNANLNNFSGFSLSKIFIPYGVIFFAFLGTAAIPEMKEELINNRKNLKKAIIIGSLIPLFIYLFFTIIVVLVTGINTTEISTIGLGVLIGQKMNILSNLFAIFSMATSFLALGLALKWVYRYDFKIQHGIAWLLTCTVPLFLFLFGLHSFIETIGIVGAVAGGLDGILIIAMFNKAKKMGDRKPEYEIKNSNLFNFILIVLFLLGIVSVFGFI